MNSQVQNRTHWKQLINPKYLGVYCLPNGQDLTINIPSISHKIVIDGDKNKEECTVAQLINSKPIIFNQTNCKTIEHIYGLYLKDYVGKVFEPFIKVVGKIVACLRIGKVVLNIQKTLHPIRPQQFNKVVEINHYTFQQIVGESALTQDQYNQLNGVKNNETN
ncbi:hypothetical protein [Acinetobacter guillouiae]|uniref:hypothetical protein n=1 Tax=Acinetobacter guillouiae TaxID=106649 RepID=UPI0032B3C96F